MLQLCCTFLYAGAGIRTIWHRLPYVDVTRWAVWYNTLLLIELMPKGVSFPSLPNEDVIAGVSGQQEVTEQQRAEAEAAAVAAQRQAENLEHAQLRAQLEEASLPLMLDAMWAANVLDIENTLRHVCKKVNCPLGIQQTCACSRLVNLSCSSERWRKSHFTRPWLYCNLVFRNEMC